MTSSRARHGRRGASSLGCLFSLLIFVGALYYGVNIGEVFFRYYRLIDEMDSQARLASAIDDATIRHRVQATAQDIGLPDEAQQIRIIRRAQQREIIIETAYSETVDLPLFHHTFAFHPKSTQPL
ncbi:MAG TPA: hypothetical protein VH116_02910 [Gemmatimonadales bacterium]|nr:hypothetical protein [Gemmatimonadales bacterium]